MSRNKRRHFNLTQTQAYTDPTYSTPLQSWQDHQQLIDVVLAPFGSISDETRLILTQIGIYYQIRETSSHEDALELARHAGNLIRFDERGSPLITS